MTARGYLDSDVAPNDGAAVRVEMGVVHEADGPDDVIADVTIHFVDCSGHKADFLPRNEVKRVEPFDVHLRRGTDRDLDELGAHRGEPVRDDQPHKIRARRGEGVLGVLAGDLGLAEISAVGRSAELPFVGQVIAVHVVGVGPESKPGAAMQLGVDVVEDRDAVGPGVRDLPKLPLERALDVPHVALAVGGEVHHGPTVAVKLVDILHGATAVLGERQVANALLDVVAEEVRALVCVWEGGAAVGQAADEARLGVVVVVCVDRIVVPVALALRELAVLTRALTERPAQVVALVDDVDVFCGFGVVVTADLRHDVPARDPVARDVPVPPVKITATVRPARRRLRVARQIPGRDAAVLGDPDDAAGVLVCLLRPGLLVLVAEREVDVTIGAPLHLATVVPVHVLAAFLVLPGSDAVLKSTCGRGRT